MNDLGTKSQEFLSLFSSKNPFSLPYKDRPFQMPIQNSHIFKSGPPRPRVVMYTASIAYTHVSMNAWQYVLHKQTLISAYYMWTCQASELGCDPIMFPPPFPQLHQERSSGMAPSVRSDPESLVSTPDTEFF